MKHPRPMPPFSRLRTSKRPLSGNARLTLSAVFILLAAFLAAPTLDAGQAASKPQLSAAHKAWLEDEAVNIITATERSVRIKSDWPKAYHRLGLVYLNKGDLPKALENLKK